MREVGGVLVIAAIAVTARAEPPPPFEPAPQLLDDMNGDRPAFRLLPAPPGVHLVQQSIEHGDGRFGEAEHMALAIPAGAPSADRARRFVEFLLGADGRRIMEATGFSVLAKPWGVGPVPAELKTLLE